MSLMFLSADPAQAQRNRDLVADLAPALAKQGIRLMVYLPVGAPSGDTAARAALKWQPGPYRNAEFQRNWESIIREWALRWGDKVSGVVTWDTPAGRDEDFDLLR